MKEERTGALRLGGFKERAFWLGWEPGGERNLTPGMGTDTVSGVWFQVKSSGRSAPPKDFEGLQADWETQRKTDPPKENKGTETQEPSEAET